MLDWGEHKPLLLLDAFPQTRLELKRDFAHVLSYHWICSLDLALVYSNWKVFIFLCLLRRNCNYNFILNINHKINTKTN